jgi:hypothetical protein
VFVPRGVSSDALPKNTTTTLLFRFEDTHGFEGCAMCICGLSITLKMSFDIEEVTTAVMAPNPYIDFLAPALLRVRPH